MLSATSSLLSRDLLRAEILLRWWNAAGDLAGHVALVGADLVGADLVGAALVGAALVGADLVDAFDVVPHLPAGADPVLCFSRGPGQPLP
jgi:Pentapeptide repeats (8 copies)